MSLLHMQVQSWRAKDNSTQILLPSKGEPIAGEGIGRLQSKEIMFRFYVSLCRSAGNARPVRGKGAEQ